MELADEELRPIALRHALRADLSRVARRTYLNIEALDDIADHALKSGAFNLDSKGKVQSLSGEGVEAWAARLLEDMPFYREPTAKPSGPTRNYGAVGDGGAARRLDLANERSARGSH